MPSSSGGLGLVAGVAVQGVVDRLHLDLAEVAAGGLAGGSTRRSRREAKRLGRCFGRDRQPVAEDQRVLDHVGQLADVARPRVAATARPGRLR